MLALLDKPVPLSKEMLAQAGEPIWLSIAGEALHVKRGNSRWR
jgi:hypothetical protein